MAFLPVALFAALMLYLGQRLVRSGLRSRGAELWLGLCFVPVGLSLGPRFALAMGLDLGDDPARVNLVCQAAVHLGMACFAVFVWRTFRPKDAWASRLCGAIAGLLAVNLVLFQWTGAAASQAHPFHIAVGSSLSLVFAWGFLEAVRFYGSMRRRLALGLADPLVANRFLLFALWTGGMTVLPLLVAGVRIANMIHTGRGWTAPAEAGIAVTADAQWALQIVRIAVLVIGFPTLAGIWLAFFPPGRYARWVERRAGEVAPQH
jgi:hypothetical protein